MHQILTSHDNHKIGYYQTAGKLPGVIFLGGFMSDMNGSKATYLERLCKELGQAFIRFDYLGHGVSSGRFEEGTIGIWLENTLLVIDTLTSGPQILVGSSMGGWLMVLAAQKRLARVHALVGIASAPDFVEDLDKLSHEQRTMLEKQGFFTLPSQFGEEPYIITSNLLEEGRRHRVLHQSIPIECPVRLLHGMLDADVPYQKSLDLADRLASKDVTVTLIKNGEHRLNAPAELKLLGDAVTSLVIPAQAGIQTKKV